MSERACAACEPRELCCRRREDVDKNPASYLLVLTSSCQTDSTLRKFQMLSCHSRLCQNAAVTKVCLAVRQFPTREEGRTRGNSVPGAELSFQRPFDKNRYLATRVGHDASARLRGPSRQRGAVTHKDGVGDARRPLHPSPICRHDGTPPRRLQWSDHAPRGEAQCARASGHPGRARELLHHGRRSGSALGDKTARLVVVGRRRKSAGM